MIKENKSLPNGWEMKTLGDVCDVFNGSTPLKSKKEFWDNGEINWFTINDIRKQGRFIKYTQKQITSEGVNSTSITLLPKDSVLLCCTASVGEYAITEIELTTNQQFNGLVVKEEDGLLAKYLFHYVSTLKKELLSKSGKTTIDFVSMTKVKNILIPLPPLTQQKQIVATLDKAFASIDTAKTNTEQNLKNSKELFESYLQNVFTNKGEDWEEKKLKEVCELKSGTTISKSLERIEGDVLYTKVGDMNLPDNEVEINTSTRFVNSTEIKINQIIPNGAIIFPKRGGAIATNKKRKIIKPTIVDLNTMAIIPGSNINKDYFFHWFQLFDLLSISNGANIPQINNYSFDSIYLPYPNSLEEQNQIVKKLDALSAETKKLEVIYTQKAADLEELKKSVLQKAFNGELVK